MGLYKKGNTWWFIKQYKGRRVEESLGTSNKRLAERFFYEDKLPKILNGSYFEPQQRIVTFRELIEKYMEKNTNKRDAYTIKKLLPHFGAMIATEIDIEDVEDYLDSRFAEGTARATVYQEFALARAMYNVARKKWKKEFAIRENPFADAGFPSYDNKRKRYLSLGEEKKLLSAASPEWVKDVIIFAIHTGCRRGEILSAMWKSNIDMKKQVVTIQASKNGNEKKIPMSNTLYEMLLKREKVVSISGRIFDVTVSALKDAFDRAVAKAGINDFHFHDLRHTFGSRLIQMEIDFYKVKDLMGHKSIRMTERYAHHSTESLKPAALALENYYRFTTVDESGSCLMKEKSRKIKHGSV
jgi:integrase